MDEKFAISEDNNFKADLKFKIIVLELLRGLDYKISGNENSLDEKMKKRISRLISNLRDELTKISKIDSREDDKKTEE